MAKRGRPKGSGTGPRVYDPEKHCGYPSKTQGGKPCTNPKGFKTNHPGIGHCRKHPGGLSADVNITHGRSAKKTLLKTIYGEVQERAKQEDHKFMDLREKCALVEVLIEQFVKRLEADREKFDVWVATASEDFEALMTSTDPQRIASSVERLREQWRSRPDVRLDVSPIVKLVEESRMLADTMHRMKMRDSIPMTTFKKWILPQMMAGVSAHANEEIGMKISMEWRKIRW